jgi:hypothetical protein
MTYESSSNMPLASLQRYYECKWADDFPPNKKAHVAIQMANVTLLQAALREGATINHPTRPLIAALTTRAAYDERSYTRSRFIFS